MGTYSAQVKVGASGLTDAEWRALVGAVVNGLIAAGATQASDSGQIDPATTTAPTSIGQDKGYFIGRFNDALHSGGFPIYYKLRFLAANPATHLTLELSVGRGTDGAGTLTDQISITLPNATIPPQALAKLYFSAADDRLTLGFFVDHTSNVSARLWLLERTRDADGTANDDGIVLAQNIMNTGQSDFMECVPNAGLPWGSESRWHSLLTTRATTVYGTTVAVYPIFPILSTILNPILGAITYRSGDITSESVVTVPVYGVLRSFLTLEFTTAIDNNNAKVAILWE